jgi:uncharacterized membrane protein
MRSPSASGAVGAVVAAWLSLTPSLLPRSALMQGVITGLAAAVGYGAVVMCAALLRPLRRRVAIWDPTPRTRWRLTIAGAVVATVGSLTMTWVWLRYQQRLRELMDMATLASGTALLVPVVALASAGVLLLVGRLVGGAIADAWTWLESRLARPATLAMRIGVVVVLVVSVLSGAVVKVLTAPVGAVYSQLDKRTAAGVSAPTSPLRSGGPGSLVRWDCLGTDGRSFVSGGPTVRELREFAARSVLEPIRVYAGLRSAGSLEEEAALVVEELDRTDAWDRAVLAVYTSTGTGLVDAQVANSLELLWAGDTAIASMQYSYLPSWMSFLADRSSAADAGRVLVDSVRRTWDGLPAGERPKLVVVGESLGSYGTESAFEDAEELLEEVDAGYLIGPPFMSPIWQQLVDERDPGSPVWLPEVGSGASVRFANGHEQLEAPFPGWGERRMLYLDHGSDPVTWWSPSLIWRRPEWLEGERAPDVSPDMVWMPMVTFLQTGVDLANAQSVPVGHGHNYGATISEGWAALLPPSGWTQADTTRLHRWMQRR